MPFLWIAEHGMKTLPVPSGYSTVRPIAIDNRGMVLLQARNSPFKASTQFLLLRSGWLKELPDAEPDGYTQYTDLNDRGWLVGIAMKGGGEGPRPGRDPDAVGCQRVARDWSAPQGNQL